MRDEVPTVPARATPKRGQKAYDPNRFYCPYPGCNRSFAELWRLKVHYRAAPDVRGSGKERGHGAELKACPKCGAELKPGRHHVGCAAGRSAPRQQAKRRHSKGTSKRKVKDEEEDDGERGHDRRLGFPVAVGGVGTNTNPLQIAMGIPAPWIPLDFSQFSNPLPPAHPVLPNPTAFPVDPLPDDDSIFNLVFGNEGEVPTMATAQLGQDFSFDFSFDQFLNDPEPPPPATATNEPCVQPEADRPKPDVATNVGVPGTGASTSGHSPELDFPFPPLLDEVPDVREKSSRGRCSAEFKTDVDRYKKLKVEEDCLLDPFPEGVSGNGLTVGDGLGLGLGLGLGDCVVGAHLIGVGPQSPNDSDFLVQTGPVMEPLSIPVRDENLKKGAGGVGMSLMSDDRGLLNCTSKDSLSR